MTAITARPLSDSTDSLLRFGLRTDATLSALFGLIIAMAADPLSRLSGLSATTEWIIGAGFVVCSTVVYALASLRDVRRIGIALVIGNVAFSALVVVTVLAGWLPLTEFGVGATLATGLSTLVMACLQYLGVRRLPA
jgi:hypothetical protein